MRTVDPEVVNNVERHQFEIREDESVARLRYALRDGAIELIHTEVPPELEGRGLGRLLAVAALEYAIRESLVVVPTCPFVRSYIRKHPEYERLTYRTDD